MVTRFSTTSIVPETLIEASIRLLSLFYPQLQQLLGRHHAAARTGATASFSSLGSTSLRRQ